MRIQHPSIALIAVLAAATAACSGYPTATGEGRAAAPRAATLPNVVFITVDTLRVDRIGVYGSTTASTPNLDALAARGARFDRAYATFPKTNPALASLMTGRYPSAHGVRRNGAHLPESELTLAEILQAAGYDTAAFASNFVTRARHGLAQGFALYDEDLPDAIVTRQAKERTAGPLVDAVLGWAGKSPSGPTFLWVHFIDPHGPYTPPGYAEKAPRVSRGGRTLPVSATSRGAYVIPAYQALPGVTEVDEYVARYDAEVEYMDAEVGRLVEGLSSSGLLQGAIVVLVADHGESLGDHGLFFQHGSSLYDPQIHVPLIILGPGIAPRVVDETVSQVDVMPTVLEMLGLPVVRGIQGSSLGGLLTGPAAAGSISPSRSGRVLFAELDRMYAVIEGSRKLIWDAESKEIEFHDLATDPEEARDIPPGSREGERRLLEAVSRFTRENFRDEARATDEETIRNLKSLGYVE